MGGKCGEKQRADEAKNKNELKRYFVGFFFACSCWSATHAKLVFFVFVFNNSLTFLLRAAGPWRHEGREGAEARRARRRGGRGGAEGTRRRGGHAEARAWGHIASHRIAPPCCIVSRAPLARHSRVTRASRTHAPTPLTTMMTTTRRDDDTAATPCVAVAAVYHVGGVGVTWRRGDVTPPPRAWGGVGVTWRCGDVPSRPARMRGARRGRAFARERRRHGAIARNCDCDRTRARSS